MHQYTADLAERMANGEWLSGDVVRSGEEERGGTNSQPLIHLITTDNYPVDRYGPNVLIHTPLTTTGTGFGRQGLDILSLRRVLASLDTILAEHTGVAEQRDTVHPSPFTVHFTVHFTGVHLWNPLLLMALRQRGVRTIHTLHDVDPHYGVRFGSLIRLWNHMVIRQADQVLVHGRRYQEQLIAQGLSPHKVTYTPLLHGFWGADKHEILGAGAESVSPTPASMPTFMPTVIGERLPTAVKRSTVIGKHPPLILFFGRVEAYKGISVLLAAWEKMNEDLANSGSLHKNAQLLLAGPVAVDMPLPSLPPGVELRNRRISDEEGIDLFQRCSLVVLPYIDATQSALIAAAYFFAKPVIVTRSGALPEYVIEGRTGWVVPPNDVDHLASALRHALADPDRLRRMGLAGRLWYEQQRLLEGQTLHDMYSRTFAQQS